MRLFLDRWRNEEGDRMDGESGSTSPTSADVAEKMGIKNEEPPADEPLALVKKVKIKVEPGVKETAEQEQPMDLAKPIDSKTDIKTQIKSEIQTSSMPVLTTGANAVPQNVIYTYANGVVPTVPQLVDLIPTNVNGKSVRPFKAYNANRELLAGLPTSATYPAVPVALSGPVGAAVPLSVPTVAVSSNSAVQGVNSNGAAHLMTLATEADKLSQNTLNGHIKKEGDSDEDMTPGSTSGGSDAGSAGDLLEETIKKIKKKAGIAAEKSVTITSSATAAPITVMVPIAPAPSSDSSSKKTKKRTGNPLPDQKKDDHYWERRRKNNEAAKRSRDARRAKEDQIAIRAALLEQENMRLRIEVAALKEETVRLRAMLVNKK